MFKLLFFHIDILFTAYQLQELNTKNPVIEKSYEVPKLETNNSIEPITITSNEKLEKLSPKQRQKYFELSKKLKEERDPVKKNKINSGLNSYKKLLNK